MITQPKAPTNGLDDYVPVESGCWEWQGRMDRNGYGKGYDATRPAGKRVDWVHRISYRHHKGEIPGGYEIDHTCENTRCINPDHLDAVTKPEHARRTHQRAGSDIRHQRAALLRSGGLSYGQIADALELSNRGAAHSMVKRAIDKGLVDPDTLPPALALLDEADHHDIAALYAYGITQPEIAAWYGVHNSQVSRILSKMAAES